MPTFEAVLGRLIDVTIQSSRNLAVLAVVFSLLAMVAPTCNKTGPWWRKPDLSTDLCWALAPGLFLGYARTLLLVAGLAAFHGITGPDATARFFAEGRGPLAGLAFWPQVAAHLLGSDLVLYVTHRLFHTARLWRFHAVHHSSVHLEWISASRFHPLDQILHGALAEAIMLLLGVRPEVLVWLMPFTVGTSALSHANLDWDFGPLRRVIASPVFHRWHHTSADRGGSSNFAATFPMFDLLFGTFHMPQGQRPDAYGVDDRHFPVDFTGQLLHPFRRRRAAPPIRPVPEPACPVVPPRQDASPVAVSFPAG